jgi:hypothetical protein
VSGALIARPGGGAEWIDDVADTAGATEDSGQAQDVRPHLVAVFMGISRLHFVTGLFHGVLKPASSTRF